jgi:hypothetical protein
LNNIMPSPSIPRRRSSTSFSAAIAVETLDREFLAMRGKLLEVAAALDRVERGQGPSAGDPRLETIREALAMLAQEADRLKVGLQPVGIPASAGKSKTDDDHAANRAERLQLIFSLPYDPGWRKG